jgi:plastocyanin
VRSLSLTLTLTLGSLGLLGLTPQPTEASGRRSCRGVVYYYAPAPATYAPPVYYHPGPMSRQPHSYPAPMYGQPFVGRPSGPAQPTTAASVGVSDNTFRPPTLTVLPGTTVRWVNSGRHTHTVTSDDGRWDSGDIPPGGSYTATFQQPGTYPYHCRHHKGMQGTVVVK